MTISFHRLALGLRPARSSGRFGHPAGLWARRRTLDGVGADGDVAAENRAFINHELGRTEVAFIAGALLELDAIAGGEVSADVALDDDGAGFDVGGHLCLLGNVQPAGRRNLAFK